MNISKHLACICEGSSELAIIDILLDNNKLIFDKDNLIENRPIRCREAKVFEEKYLRKNHEEKLTIIRILDSRKENFKLSKAYEYEAEIINVITSPEIEILIILEESEFEHFKRSRKKPSQFCKEELKMHEVKSYEFVRRYFINPSKLIDAIIKYRQTSNIPKNEHTLFELLK